MVIFVDIQNDFQNIMGKNFVESIEKIVKYLDLMNKNYLFIKSNYFQVDVEKEVILDRLDGTHTGKKICIENTYGSKNHIKLYYLIQFNIVFFSHGFLLY